MFKVMFDEAGSGDLSWLGSAHATDAAQTVTLDGSTVTDDGMKKSGVPAGLPLQWSADGSKVTVCSDPSKLAGFLLTKQSWDGGNMVVPMLIHGVIKVGKLPVTFDASTVTNGAFTFLGKKGA